MMYLSIKEKFMKDLNMKVTNKRVRANNLVLIERIFTVTI